jgi:predicted XRE-type DNA-binding protein
MNNPSTPQDYIESSGNIFADMGLEEADELLTRAQLGYSVRQILKERELKQREVADLLDIKQSEVSLLMQGKYHLFSEGRLFTFLNKLDRKVIIQISPHQEGEPFQQIAISA